MTIGHSPRDMRQRKSSHRSPPARVAFVLLLAVLAAAGGRWWFTSTSSRDAATDIAVIGDSLRGTGFSELAERDEQIRVWNIALAADTGSALVLAQLAALHAQRAREGGGWDDYLKAESLARHSIARRTFRNGAGAATLVGVLLAQHRFTEARDVARALVQRESDVPEYRALLGDVAMELGDDALADSMFRSVWEDRAILSIAPRVARWLELNGHVSDARTVLLKARDEALSRRNIATETKAWFALRVGDLELRASNLRRAEKAYRQGLRVEGGDPRLLAAMARLEMARANPRGAIVWGERAIGLQLDPATIALVGDAYTALGDTAMAEQFTRTLEVSVESEPGAYHRAWSLHLLDRNRRVGEVLNSAMTDLRERRDVYGCDLAAWALYKAERYVEAQAMMQQALRLGTQDPLLLRHAVAIDAAAARQLAAR